MAYKLEKPVTDIQRADFVVAHQGMAFCETDDAIYFLEETEELQNGVVTDVSDTEAFKVRIKAVTNAALQSQITALEQQSLMSRVLRDMILKDTTNPAYTKIKALDDQIATLRAQLTKE